jgi:hypothetical protein
MSTFHPGVEDGNHPTGAFESGTPSIVAIYERHRDT